MNRLEKLMSRYANLTYVFSKDMPNKLRGLCFDDEIHINTTTAEKLVMISEEIAHHEEGASNIIEQVTYRVPGKQVAIV